MSDELNLSITGVEPQIEIARRLAYIGEAQANALVSGPKRSAAC